MQAPFFIRTRIRQGGKGTKGRVTITDWIKENYPKVRYEFDATSTIQRTARMVFMKLELGDFE